MISKLVYYSKRGMVYVGAHSQLTVVLLLLLVLPLLFLYSGQQFLEAGRANQDSLLKDRIGTIHDVYASLLKGTAVDTEIVASQIKELTAQNDDIVYFSVARLEEDQLVVIASSDEDEQGTSTPLTDIHKNAAIRFGESLIFETYDRSGRLWYAYRAVEIDGQTYFITSLQQLGAIDAMIDSRESGAYATLIVLYLCIIALAYWHYRMINYQSLYEETAAQSEAKDSFLHMIAHELRAPLTAVRGFASMQQEGADVTQQQSYAEKIQRSSERMLSLVNELLDVARIRSGKLSIEMKEVELRSVLDAVVDELSGTANEHSLALSHTVGTSLTLTSDAARLQQVLVNIVNNAIKYTKEGSITIGAEVKRNVVEIRIADTGTGIEADAQKQLFAPFYRVENADTAEITGTGLGMWITKLLVAEMKGSIAVESIKGVGTHVVVKLPEIAAQS